MSCIDKIYVINLEHRKDRLDGFIKQMEKIGLIDKVERIDAISLPNFGALGCSKSHLIAINKIINSEYKNVLVCEDDFRFYNINEAKEYLNSLVLDFDYDIICFSGNNIASTSKIEKSEYPFLEKVCDLQTTSSYLVNKNFSQKLYNTFQESINLLEVTKSKHIYAIDMYWKRLQPISKWYLTNPKLGYQESGYSDIEKKSVKYNC